MQRGLERLYRIRSGLDVRDFVVGEDARAGLADRRRPREQLLVRHDEEGLWLGLFLDPDALANLAANDPRRRLDDANLGDLCLTVEGVSHFLYLVFCAGQERPVSQRELELQAEVDKYATCLLTLMAQGGGPPGDLWPALFRRFALDPALAPDERERYATANEQASRYAADLDRRYVRRGRLAALLVELRLFYRLSWRQKVERIARRA
ncbi:MAG TPA: hypothetical protein VGQ83_13670 [Polyangia bacterium]